MTQYLDREEQAAYLNKRGLKYSKHTLQKLASTGGGPKYVIFGNRAVSTPEWLDEWIESRISTPRRHTSEREAV